MSAIASSTTNHRKNMVRSVEASLGRLGTDYIDILYLHAWDGTTPVDEVLRAMDDLVRSGKVVYVAISDAPAWRVSRMQAIADLRGWAPLIALQIEYSLIQRTVERELIPMAQEMGLGVVPWSPLGSGVLTGKYSKADLDAGDGTADPAGTRKNIAAANGALTERGLAIAEVVKSVAAESGKTPSQIAIAWTLLNPAVTAPILGARTLKQLEDNLGALDVRLTDDQRARLDRASAVELGFPHDFLARPLTRSVVSGDVKIEARR
ncbi:aldo/keto reductase [Sorangium sp. So ce834]